jgi:hypothetical protein
MATLLPGMTARLSVAPIPLNDYGARRRLEVRDRVAVIADHLRIVVIETFLITTTAESWDVAKW